MKVDLTKYVEEHQFKFDYALNEKISNAEVKIKGFRCMKNVLDLLFNALFLELKSPVSLMDKLDLERHTR